ncbi:MAG: efflux RND transporter permease subunit [Gammaproteobacteria bacterium]|nr:efflux RND transporter permease subunit [Gammaproteobacteria bacterium]
MNLARRLIEQPLYGWLLVLLCGIGGAMAYFEIGRLEDPSFTIKVAIVTTVYPGASALEVEREVTEKVESAIQRMEQIDHLESRSLPGYSEVRVEILSSVDGSELPSVWTELRDKLKPAQDALPPNAGPIRVNDDFGDVYGLYWAVTGQGYTPAELYDYLKDLRRDVLAVSGVANVEIQGNQQEEIVVVIDQAVLVANNLQASEIYDALSVQNAVQPAGAERSQDLRIRVTADKGYSSVAAVAAVPIGRGDSPLTLGDIATVRRGYAEQPSKLIRYNGESALSFGVAGLSSENIVEIGERVEQRLRQLEPERPRGIELHPLYQQHHIVDEAVSGFVVNVVSSIAIVLVVLCLSLGWRTGAVLGIVLALTVSGTVALMWMFGLTLQRISLGALIIVMGMLADNAIVIGEGMQLRVEQGMTPTRAAGQILDQTKWALLGATVVGILAFSGIGLSPDSVGEFCFSLFAVAAISLLLSWLLAVALTPLFGSYLFKRYEENDQDPYSKPLYRRYRKGLDLALHHRILGVVIMVGLTAACAFGFRYVSQSFFPPSTTPLFYLDLRFPQGTDIHATGEHAAEVETWLLDQDYVSEVATYVGGGASRFMLVYDPQQPDPAYVQFIIRVKDIEQIDPQRPQLEAAMLERFPQADVQVIRPNFGPGGGSDIEYRISGRDPDTLRQLSRQVREIYAADVSLTAIHDDWGQPVSGVRAVVDDSRARAAGVTRPQISQLLAYAGDGVEAGVYREDDELLPIMVRSESAQRGVEPLRQLQVYSRTHQQYIPLGEVVDRFEVVTEPEKIYRRNRLRTVTVSADAVVGANATDVFQNLRPRVEALQLPYGYSGEWGGQYEDSTDAQSSLGKQMPLSFLAMILIVLLMFGRTKPGLVVLLVVPMSICGVTLSLLIFGGSFGFMALLGFLSLFGMLIKNAIVLVEEIELQIENGTPRYIAVVNGAQSRLRPVALASGTTILGMIPLLWDPFFKDMAITIMGGLAFATLLTMIAVPLLYALFYRVSAKEC